MRRIEVQLVIFLIFIHINIMFGDDQTTDTGISNNPLIKPLSEYKLKIKAKYDEKVVPMARKNYTRKKLRLHKANETQFDKLPIFVKPPKVLQKKPILKLKPTGIKKYELKTTIKVMKPLKRNKHKDNDAADLKFSNLHNGSSNEDTKFNDSVILDELRESLTNDDDDKSLYASIIDQQHWLMLPTTEKPSSTTMDINFGLDLNETWIAETTVPPTTTKPKVDGPSMLDEIDLDDKNGTGLRPPTLRTPTPMNKNETEAKIGLIIKLIETKDQEKAAALKKEFLEQTHIDNSTENKSNASLFDELDLTGSDEYVMFRPTQRSNTNKELYEKLKSLVELRKINNTWLVNELGISAEQAMKENLTELSHILNFKPNATITENSINELNTTFLQYLLSMQPKVTKAEKDSLWNETSDLLRVQPVAPNIKDLNILPTPSTQARGNKGHIYYSIKEVPQSKIQFKDKQRLPDDRHKNDKLTTVPMWILPIRTIPRQPQTSSGLTTTEQTFSFPDKLYEGVDDIAMPPIEDNDSTTKPVQVEPSMFRKPDSRLILGENTQKEIIKYDDNNINFGKDKEDAKVAKENKFEYLSKLKSITLPNNMENFRNVDDTTAPSADQIFEDNFLPPLNYSFPNKSNLWRDLELLYSKNPNMYPKRTCGIDNSPVNIVYEGSAKLQTYPWLGVLLYPYEDKIVTTSVVLVTKQIVIGSAPDINELPKVDLRDRARVILGRSCSEQGLHVLDYNYHPEYRSGTRAALVIVQIDPLEAKYELRPICAPPATIKEKIFHTMILPEDCRNTSIKVYEMIHVPTEECKYFYRRSGFNGKSTWPKHTACGRARWGGECVWRSGAALVVKQNGRWHLLGFGVHGPGCQAPARFIDYGMYRRWVADSVARIGRPAITRLGPNHLVLRRTTYKIQRFDMCDKGEVQTEIFTDETRIELRRESYELPSQGRAKYNLTIFANAEYSCVIFKASYDKQFGVVINKPRISLRRYCPTKNPMCYTGGKLRIDFYVEIIYAHPLTFKVLAYGTEREVLDPKLIMKYTNVRYKFPRTPDQTQHQLPCDSLPMCEPFNFPIIVHTSDYVSTIWNRQRVLDHIKNASKDFSFEVTEGGPDYHKPGYTCFFIELNTEYLDDFLHNKRIIINKYPRVAMSNRHEPKPEPRTTESSPYRGPGTFPPF